MDIPYEATAANYRRAKRQLEQLRDRLPEEHPDQKIIEGMISDCGYAAEWLTTSRRPGSKRGIERRATYQRDKLMDPIRMQAFVQRSTAGSPANLSDWQIFQIEEAMSALSERERECYVLHHGMCFSYQQIADMLLLKKGTVQSYIDSAQQKIDHEKLTNLFLSE